MTDKAKTWVDLGYKLAVMVGSIFIAFANMKFATKDDLNQTKIEIQKSIGSLNTAIATTNQTIGQAVDLIQRVERMEHDHEMRLRDLERKLK